MSEPLVVALALEPAATRVTLWAGGAQRLSERVNHSMLALAATGGMTALQRRDARLGGVRALLARYGEDASRPDAFVALGTGAAHAGVYAAAATGETADDDAAALVLALAAESGARALVVEPTGRLDAAPADALPGERVLIARAVARRDAFDAPGTLDAARVVVSLEEETLALALAGERIAAVVRSDVSLHDDTAERLVRRMELGDPAAAGLIAAFTDAVSRAVREALQIVPNACAIVVSGSLAQHGMIAADIARAFVAAVPVHIMPAERVERALAELASAALVGVEPVRAYG